MHEQRIRALARRRLRLPGVEQTVARRAVIHGVSHRVVAVARHALAREALEVEAAQRGVFRVVGDVGAVAVAAAARPGDAVAALAVGEHEQLREATRVDNEVARVTRDDGAAEAREEGEARVALLGDLEAPCTCEQARDMDTWVG